MEPRFLYRDIQSMLTIIKDDEKKLMAVLTCLEDQILGDENPKKEDEILPGCESTVQQIADALYNGFVCYLNPETLEIEQIAQDTYFDADSISEQNDDMLDEYALDFMKWDSYIKFEPPGPNELLVMMEKYVSQLQDSLIGSRLVSALDDLTPVTSFQKMVTECGQEDDWMDFRRQETATYVNGILMEQLYPLNIE